MLTSEMASKLAIVKSIPTESGSPPKFGRNRISYPSNILAIVCVTFSKRLIANALC